MIFNGIIFGFMIFVDWGDDFVIYVINNMLENGIVIYWYGFYMRDNFFNDGMLIFLYYFFMRDYNVNGC